MKILVSVLATVLIVSTANALCLVQVSDCMVQTTEFAIENYILQNYNGVKQTVPRYKGKSTFGYSVFKHHHTRVNATSIWSAHWSQDPGEAQSASLLACNERRALLMQSVPFCTQ